MARGGSVRAPTRLISTKINAPRRRGDILRRARLVDVLTDMADRRLYLVVAPAGYGKTTLLVDFASDCHIPVCWYSLSPADRDPALFLEYLLAAVKNYFEPGTGSGAAFKKVPLTGGPPVFVSRLDGPSRGATWIDDRTIIAASGATSTGLAPVVTIGR